MLKFLKRLTALTAAAVCALCVNASAVRYLEVSHENSIKFRDNFASGDMSNWDVFLESGKKWSVVASNGENAMTCTTDNTWLFSSVMPKIPEAQMQNCIISADFLFTEQWERSGIVLRAKDEQNLYNVIVAIDNNDGLLMLTKRMNGTQWQEKTMVRKNPLIPKNKKINVSAQILGNNIKVFLDGEPIIDYTDTDRPIETGKVGIQHTYGYTKISNVKVEMLYAEEEQNGGKTYEYKTYPQYSADEIGDFGDAVFDFYGWDDGAKRTLYFENNNLIFVPDKSTENYKYHMATYARKKFADEPIEFKVKGEPGEYTVSFKTDAANVMADENNDGYNLKFSKSELCLEKWSMGKCEILGSAEGDFISGEYRDVKINQQKEGNALKISVEIDGEKKIKAEDTKNPMFARGFVSVVSYVDGLMITASDDKVKSLKQILGLSTVLLSGAEKVYINGAVKSAGGGVAPYSENGTIMMPLRFFASELGAEVLWDSEKKSAVIKKGSYEIIVTPGYSDAFVNGERVGMKSAAKSTNGTMYVSADLFQNYFDLEPSKTDNGLWILHNKNEDISDMLSNVELTGQVRNELTM